MIAQQPEQDPPTSTRGPAWTVHIALMLLLTALAVYLVGGHYVKAYSDPIGWLGRAIRLVQGRPITKWALVYPAFLAVALRITGPAYVFLANLPLVLLLVFLLYVLTTQCVRASFRSMETLEPRIAGLVTVAVFMCANTEFVFVLLNPYREALAFSLMLSTLLVLFRALRHHRTWLMALSGGVAGLAISTRETCLLILPAIGLLFLRRLRTEQWRTWVAAGLVFGLGTLAGLVPFVIQNQLHTGHFWLPAFMSSRWIIRETPAPVPPTPESPNAAKTEKEANPGVEARRAKIRIPLREHPIPGMAWGYFRLTGAKALKHIRRKYSWFGIGAFVAGIFVAIRRRNEPLLWCLLPTGLLNFLFYACYEGFMERYFFVVELFFLPVAAIGIGALATHALRLCSTEEGRRRRRMVAAGAACLCIATVVKLVNDFPGLNTRLKVWHIRRVKEFLDVRLERPCFVLSYPHMRQMVAWFAGIGGTTHPTFAFVSKHDLHDVFAIPDDYPSACSAESAQQRRLPDVITDSDLREHGGVHTALAVLGPKFIADASIGRYYWVGNAPAPLYRCWFDFDTVGSFADMDVPLEYYTKKLTETIYRIQPWTNRALTVQTHMDAPSGNCLLAVDCGRIWDYTSRTYCRLAVNGRQVEERLPSGFHFVALTGANARTLQIEVSSDEPLPNKSYVRAHTLNADIRIPLGAGSDLWYYPFLSSNLTQFAPLDTRGCYLFDQGQVRLPNFCATNREAYANFELLYWRGVRGDGSPPTVCVQTAWGTATVVMPEKFRGAGVTVALGPGKGRLDLCDTRFTTDVVPLREQQKQTEQPRDAVRLMTVRVYSVPKNVQTALTINVGGPHDGHLIDDRFHQREKPIGVSARWTKGNACVRLPIARPPGDLAITVRTVNARPKECATAPRFALNDRGVPLDAVQTETPGKDLTDYVFTMSRENVRGDGTDVLRIRCDSWRPSQILGSRDHRDLGIMLERIVALPAQ